MNGNDFKDLLNIGTTEDFEVMIKIYVPDGEPLYFPVRSVELLYPTRVILISDGDEDGNF